MSRIILDRLNFSCMPDNQHADNLKRFFKHWSTEAKKRALELGYEQACVASVSNRRRYCEKVVFCSRPCNFLDESRGNACYAG